MPDHTDISISYLHLLKFATPWCVGGVGVRVCLRVFLLHTCQITTSYLCSQAKTFNSPLGGGKGGRKDAGERGYDVFSMMMVVTMTFYGRATVV